MRGLTAVLLVVPVAMCVALSKNEIEEFTEYLWKTSALDQNLKDGTNVDQDEEEEVSDNAWEESGKFEGDLILNERQRRLIAEDVAEGLARNGLRDSTKRWPNNEVIFYIQREHFSGDQIQAIKEGIDDLSQASCIKFRPYKKGDRDAVVIQGSRRGCFSQVGYQGGYQVLNLSGRHPVGRGCFRHGTVVHELLHTLGFYHMQSSHDRDEFIDVVWANIVQPARHNFRKYNAFSVSDFGVGYDYDSVLHYSRRAFSANGGDTLVPKQSGARIGQRVGLSDKDTQKLNKMYCDADSNNSDAAAEEPAKQKNKKKTRNQPFQGHGIGYHQGKTVVIKLPVAETYKLPDSPSYAVFDYFSKAPQALPPTLVEGLGAGKEINYYRPPVSTFDTEKDHQFKTPKEPEKSLKDKPFIEKDAETKLPAAEGFFPSSDSSKNYQKQPSINIHKDSAKEPKVDSKDHKDLLQALERLDEIIKMHIYPSSKSYATELSDKIQDYSEFFKPATKEHESKESTKDELYNLKKSEPIENNKKDTIYPKNEKLNDTSNVNRTLFVSPLYSKNYGEVDSTFGTSLPIKNPGEKFSPQYSVLSSEDDEFAYVKSYDDYSRLYKPKGKSSSSESREPYSLLGDPVPLQEDWYRENYKKPAYDSPKKKLYQYGGNILESESVKDKAIDNKEKFEDKESMSVPHEIKFSSEEDSSSIDSHPYNENSAEKMFDKYGHFRNSKTRRSDDSTEHYSPYYSYPEPRSGQMDGEDQRATLDYYNPLQKGYDWDETHEGIPTSKELNVKNRSSNDNKLIPVNEKPGEFKIKRLRKQIHSEMNNLIPKRKKTQSVSYRVTEEPEESEPDDDYSSFERSMDDRLKTIVKNYEKVNNFDIQLPYDSHNESSESSEMMVKLNDSSHDVKLKTVSTEEKNK